MARPRRDPLRPFHSGHMSQPAPRRCSVESPSGLWHSVAWSAPAILAYRCIGGWFKSAAYHDCADVAAVAALHARL